MKKLTLAEATQMINAVLAYTEKMDKPPVTCAVVDEGGHLIACRRQDGGKIGNIEIAIDKAWTAVAFKNDTEFYPDRVKPDGVAYGLQFTNKGRPCFIGGGVLIKDGEDIIGAIGISGGKVPEEDIELCRAGMKAIGS